MSFHRISLGKQPSDFRCQISFPDHSPDLGSIILQGKIAMSGGRDRNLRNLTGDPAILKIRNRPHQTRNELVHVTDGKDFFLIIKKTDLFHHFIFL